MSHEAVPEGTNPDAGRLRSTFPSTNDPHNILGQRGRDMLYQPLDYRHNKPNPLSVGFLRQNVALLNEPICYVHTSATESEQSEWWPSRANTTVPHKPQHTLDTTVREDFQYRGTHFQPPSAKHSANHLHSTDRGIGISKLNLIAIRANKHKTARCFTYWALLPFKFFVKMLMYIFTIQLF